MKSNFEGVKRGDLVIRMLGGQIPMEMKVTEVGETLIHCGDWHFDKATGIEEDAGLGWGVAFNLTGSYLLPLGSKMPEEAAPNTVPAAVPIPREKCEAVDIVGVRVFRCMLPVGHMGRHQYGGTGEP